MKQFMRYVRLSAECADVSRVSYARACRLCLPTISRTLVNNGVEHTMPNNPSNPNRDSKMGSPNPNAPRQEGQGKQQGSQQVQGQGKQQDKSNLGSQQPTKDRGMSGSGRDDSGH
ncbi:hypothetical protein LVB87_01255 [Lysobacter sp. KIS68-7]|uniref:hypothetical protein n=1 Tax=Lysobacter sp. KIS68-7 TaxID=2904252 RepID=UPI001E4C6F0B|nr:hypothetical protein [Lysobacter sp. KIS68-7]UHQ19822.1 hypothetical protein LVB87_01255 [Lysobacter sp. KIS68-7]